MVERLLAPRVILCHANEERERERIRSERQDVRMRAHKILAESQQILREADIVLARVNTARISATDEIPPPPAGTDVT
jgi:nucleoside 2-deoxyribosyltransferase